jgi:hypothetical protein
MADLTVNGTGATLDSSPVIEVAAPVIGAAAPVIEAAAPVIEAAATETTEALHLRNASVDQEVTAIDSAIFARLVSSSVDLTSENARLQARIAELEEEVKAAQSTVPAITYPITLSERDKDYFLSFAPGDTRDNAIIASLADLLTRYQKENNLNLNYTIGHQNVHKDGQMSGISSQMGVNQKNFISWENGSLKEVIDPAYFLLAQSTTKLGSNQFDSAEDAMAQNLNQQQGGLYAAAQTPQFGQFPRGS